MTILNFKSIYFVIHLLKIVNQPCKIWEGFDITNRFHLWDLYLALWGALKFIHIDSAITLINIHDVEYQDHCGLILLATINLNRCSFGILDIFIQSLFIFLADRFIWPPFVNIYCSRPIIKAWYMPEDYGPINWPS